jgi:hypothetical protein
MRWWDDVLIVSDRDMIPSSRPMLGMLQALCLQPRLYQVNEEQHLDAWLTGDLGTPRATVVFAHGVQAGDERAIRFPVCRGDPAEPSTLRPEDVLLTPTRLRERLRRGSGLLMMATCSGGSEAFADVFLSAGYSHYVAPAGYFQMSSGLLFFTAMFTLLLGEDREPPRQVLSVAQAVEIASAIEPFPDGTRAFRCFEAAARRG